MRIVSAQATSAECSVIAVYNMARILQLPSAKGGYRKHRSRLIESTGYIPRQGCMIYRTRWAVIAELLGSPYRIQMRRPFWNNVVSQLQRAKPPAVAVLVYSLPDEGESDGVGFHTATVWRPHGRDLVLAANACPNPPITPFWIYEHPVFWKTEDHPVVRFPRSKVVAFWQVVPRGGGPRGG